MFNMTFTLTRPSTSIPFYHEILPANDNLVQRNIVKVISAGYVSTLITVQQSGLSIEIVDTWDTELNYDAYYALITTLAWFPIYQADSTAYNAANNITETTTVG